MTVVHSRGTRLVRLLPALVCGFSAVLCGCHGSDIVLPGTPVMTMGGQHRSPDPDFAAYIVQIDAITFTRNDGTVVEPLSYPETVDLTKLTTMAELVEAPAVPEGTYLSAAVTIDYTSASIFLNEFGRAVPAVAVDSGGVAMSTATVTITFDPAHPLVITASQSDRVDLDFDLAAFNSIDFSTSVITVQPFIVATPAPVDQTVMRVRGDLVVVQSPNDYIANIRPFYDLVSALGAITVNVNDQTYYNINGVTYTGTAGLTALNDTQLANTAVAAYGTLDNLSTITPTFNATQVYAGSSLESELEEYVSGTVSGRAGDVLTVRGVTYLSDVGVVSGYPFAQVTISPTTVVSEDGVANSALSTDDVTVGSQINVSGQAGVSAANELYLDASGAQVRLAPNQLWGGLHSAAAGSAELELLSLNNYPAAGFDFAGAGAAGTPVDPNAYQVNTGTFDLSGVGPGGLVEATGMLAPFGAPPPNFIATSVSPGSSEEQQLVLQWVNGGAIGPFSSVTSAGLVVKLDNGDLGALHYIRTGPSTIDLKSLPASPLITTTGAPPGDELVLAIGNDTLTAGVSVFNSLAPFITRVLATFPGSNTTNRIYQLVAYGQYNSSTNTFVATRIYVALEEVTAS
jgi:hypothetical protein